jgi:hypothetical protein
MKQVEIGQLKSWDEEGRWSRGKTKEDYCPYNVTCALMRVKLLL